MKGRYLIGPGIAALVVLGIVALAAFHGGSISVLNPAGPIALAERNVIGITVMLAAIVVLPVFFLLFYFAWKYKADDEVAKIEHAPNWDHDSWITEFVWWLVPTVIVVFLALLAWHSSHELDPFKPIPSTTAPITVDVIALDWKWLFIYPEQGIASVNMLEFPEKTPVHFYLTSDAPMNSFWIPSLGGQIMAMPGMTTQLNLLASKIGTFNGFSAEISGDGFAGMSFTAKAVSPQEFATWVASVKSESRPLTSETYAALARPSEYVPPEYYSSVDPSLYTAEVLKYMMRMPSQPTPTSNAMSGMNMSM